MQAEMLDRPRQVHHADVLFDSSVICANDDDAERKLHALTDLLVAHSDQGNVWFSLMTLSELIAPGSAETRVELIKRFRNLYLRFGERVRFMRSLDDNIRAECTTRRIPSKPASVVDGDVAKSIAAGDLVGLLKEGRDDWDAEKRRLREKYQNLVEKNRQQYERSADFRFAFAQCVPTYFSAEGLNQCDNIARDLIAEANPSLTLDTVKARYQDYPCIWTFSLLGRLAQYAQTITDDERKQHFPAFQDVLKPDPNDFIDADIAGTGASCGMMISNDRGLIAKLNRLYDANLIRLQAFTVSDALLAYNPPNGRVREPAGVAPS
jgi:hypothetical protein